MNDTNGKTFVEHWDWATKKGLMNRNTAGTLKSASVQVLSVIENWEDIDVRSLDIDDTLTRFQNLRNRDFTPDSLNAYKRRFRTALNSFLSYVDNPSGWKPQSREPSQSKPTRNDESKIKKASTHSTRIDTSKSSEMRVGLVEYPYPLRQGLVVSLHLPADLKLVEVKRLTAFMQTLTVDYEIESMASA